MTAVCLLLLLFSDVPVWLFAVAMICDTALLVNGVVKL